MGQVYLATSPSGDHVAVKVIRSEYVNDEEFRRRFAHEVDAAGRVHSPYTVPVVDADPDAERPWLATRYVPGPSLDRALAEHGPLPAAGVATLMYGVAEALHAMHAVQVIHRDLKPANVLLCADRPRVIDFGIAKAVDTTPLTSTGVRLGTPRFMAPEQAEGRPALPASDVFALGGLACYAATGHAPFGDGQEAAILYRVVHDEPAIEGCPPELREVIARCLAKDPALRPTPLDLMGELRAHAPGDRSWLPPEIARSLPTYTGPATTPPPSRSPRRFGPWSLAAAALAGAAVTAAALVPFVGRREAVQAQSPTASTTHGPTPAPTSTGRLLGTYRDIDVTFGYSLDLTGDPRHPKRGAGDLRYAETEDLEAAKLSLLDPGKPGDYRSCLDNTRYLPLYDVQEARKRLVCVRTDTAIALVKVTDVVYKPAHHIRLDLTVWSL
ncbi:MAG: serine/threonine protein kinase [Nonomuraea sp.]|nr:serine/threonine protein kinase [Nonomuraea sp.]